LRLLAVVPPVLLLFACTSVPPRQAAVASLTVTGNSALDDGEVQDKLATRQSPAFLGLIQEFFYEPETFNRHVLARDLERVKRYYQSRGFYQASVSAARVRYEDPEHVHVTVAVTEGEPTLIREIRLHGVEALPEDVSRAARAALDAHLAAEDRFEEEPFAQAEQAILRALTERGYAYASVSRRARVDLAGNFSVLDFEVKPDEPAVFGELRIEGLSNIPEAPVRRALSLKPGDEFSSADLERAQQAVLELGVFSSAHVGSALEDPPPTPRVIPVEVDLAPSALRTVRFGGGLQLDSLQTDAHLLAGWEDRNFMGGLRRLNLETRPGVVFYPSRLDNLRPPTNLLPELGLLAEFEQPGFLEARTKGFVRGRYNIYTVIRGLGGSQGVLGYREARVSVGLERSLGRHLYARSSQNFQTNVPFAYVGSIPSDLSNLFISYTELLTTVDFRNSSLVPTKGFELTLPVQYAGLGGHARDMRFLPEARLYVPLSSRLTLATRGRVGLLFPFNYGPASGNAREAQIVFFRGFFAGGSTSNRGYTVRGIGPHGPLPFFYVDGENNCASEARADCNVAQGGFSSVEISAELRVDLSGPTSLTFFCDVADVAAGELEFRATRPHLSCGPGLRYETPVGPIRADIGVRVPGAQVLDGGAIEGNPPELFGLPIAIALGIGEVF
jgi:outer membrane protein insertion porin family/translocation and assembly module TamA